MALGQKGMSLCFRRSSALPPTVDIGRLSAKGCFAPILLQKWKINNPKNLAKVGVWTSLLLRRFSTPLRRSVIDFG
jgi:hypothetical protein